MRAAGEKWTGGGRQGELVDALLQAAGDNAELAHLVRSSGAILEEFLEGCRRNVATGASATVPRDLAAYLIAGRSVPQAVVDSLAARYLVVVARGSATARGSSSTAARSTTGCSESPVSPDATRRPGAACSCRPPR